VIVADRVEIELFFTPDGEVRLETHGLKGQACVSETESLEKALGRVTSRLRTGEFYQQAAAVTGTVKRR
jgi:hypothetical protein